MNAKSMLCMSLGLILGSGMFAYGQERHEFKLRAAAGERWSFENLSEMKMTTQAVANGQVMQQAEILVVQRRKGTVDVIEAAGGVATAVRVSFDAESANKMSAGGQSQDPPFPLAGKTVTVRRDPGGQVVHDFQDAPLDPMILQELERFLAPDTGMYPAKPVAVGESWDVPREAAIKTFSLGPQDDAAVRCTLESVKSVAGRSTGQIKMVVTVTGHPQPGLEMKMNVEGPCSIDFPSGRMTRADLSGKTSMSGGMEGSPVTMTGDGAYTLRAETKLLSGAGETAQTAPPPAVPPSDTRPEVLRQPPAPDAPAAGVFAGTYRNPEMSIELSAGPGGYTGTIRLGTQSFPVKATEQAGKLVGTFTSEGAPFDFAATIEADTLSLSTGGTTHKLTRERPEPQNPLSAPPKPAEQPLNPLDARSSRGDSPTGGEPPGAAPRTQTFRFRKQTVHDDMAGCDAFSLLVPIDWKLESKFLWRAHNVDPCPVWVHIQDPSTATDLTIFPSMRFTYGQREEALAGMLQFGLPAQYRSVDEAAAFYAQRMPDGMNYQGSELRPMPSSPAEFVKQYVLPRCRPEVKDYRIVSTIDLPQVAAVLAEQGSGLPGFQASASRTRIEYILDGRPVEEDLYINLTSFPSTVGLRKSGWWSTSGPLSFRAEKGKLDERTKVLQAIQHSLRPTVQWFNAQRQVAAITQRGMLRSIQAAGQIAQITAQSGSEVSEMIWDQYRKNDAAADRIQHEYVKTIRGVEEYHDPFQDRTIELPHGYQNAWVNGSGEYVLSDNPNFDPNIGATREWRKMDRTQQ